MATTKAKPPGSSGKGKRALLALVAIVIFGGLAWGYWPFGEDPAIARMVELQQQVFNPNTKMADADRRKAFEEMRTIGESLTPEQRRRLMRENPPPFARRMQQTIVSYFDLPPDQKKAALDKSIDQMERMRKEWEKRRADRAQRPGGPGGGPGFGRPGGPGGRGNMDQAQRNQFRKNMLDNTSPAQRAMFSEYFRDLEQRRKDRGLPPMGPGGPRR